MTGDLEILTLENKKKWHDLVKSSYYFDLHFLPEYLEPFEDHLNAKALLARYADKDGEVLFPFFKRRLCTNNDSPDLDPYYDVISPWYYGGPIFIGNRDEDRCHRFSRSFKEYCVERNIVSLFSRFHPYLGNNQNISKKNVIDQIGVVMWIDLTMSKDRIWKKSFSGECRKEIRRINTNKFDIQISRNRNDLKKFHQLYVRAMQEKETENFYMFDLNFLEKIYDNLKDNFIMIFQDIADETVAASIKLFNNDIMYGFLGARNSDFPLFNNYHLIIFESILYGKEKGIKIFDLGGGKEGSSLLHFKKKFSRNKLPLFGQKEIFNIDLYKKICESAGCSSDKLKYESASFFPEYRIERC